MNLVIVESPAKGRTIEKYLGKDYKVLASFGHVRDLPAKELGVDVEHNYIPKYVIPSKARKTINALKDAISKSDTVYMASDYDREGEAIAWHVIQATGLEKQKSNDKGSKSVKRITFHEITEDAIKNAINNPREIDVNLVNSQQARRILDRLVGYKLSPFLWKKVYKGLSAGRVQSVAVRLIVDREKEIKAFMPQEYWDIKAKLKKQNSKLKNNVEFIANLIEKNGKKIEKLEIKSEENAKDIISELENAKYRVDKIDEHDENRFAYPPFTTSTLQQESSKRLGYTAKKTMKLAQDLYEDGLITYMRTDSVNLASIAINSIRALIDKEFGAKYLPNLQKIYKTKSKGAQEAHEAIRPSYVDKKPDQISAETEEHRKLYDLIWRRAVACQMNPMILATTSVDVIARLNKDNKTQKPDDYKFRANGSMIKFDGFGKVWPLKIEEKTLPQLNTNEILDLIDLLKEQHFTQPPARFTEASLIKALEDHGIGRPSTYAPIISTIQDRRYVYIENKAFYPNESAFIVTDLLTNNFPQIVDLNFTAKMENELDDVAEGKEDWVKMLDNFYKPFIKNLEEKEKTVEKTITDEKTDKICPKCKKELVIKTGKFGKFLACTGFPNCRYTEQAKVDTGIKCPECKKGDVLERRTRKGKIFWGCENYPKCKWATWEKPVK